MKTIIGIDLGWTGGITFFDLNGKHIETFPMPVLGTKSDKELDRDGLLSIFNKHDVEVAYCETQFSKKGEGISSIRTNAYNEGVIHMALFATGITIEPVKADEWKRALNLYNDPNRSYKLKKITKKDSVFKANILFDTKFLVKEDGLAESALIAYYGLIRSKQS